MIFWSIDRIALIGVRTGLLFQGYREIKNAAALKLISRPYMAVMGFDNNLAYIQTKSSSMDSSGRIISDSVKTLKDIIDFALGYAYSGIGYADDNTRELYRGFVAGNPFQRLFGLG